MSLDMQRTCVCLCKHWLHQSETVIGDLKKAKTAILLEQKKSLKRTDIRLACLQLWMFI